ncbi:hypothetical protein [Escherichia phage FL18]
MISMFLWKLKVPYVRLSSLILNPFSYELLHVTMQSRLYHNPGGILPISSRLTLRPKTSR